MNPPAHPSLDRARSGAGLLAHLVGLDHVVDLDVVERPQADAALVALANLGRVVLEPLERVDGEVLRDDGAVTDETCLGVAADLTAADQGTSDVAELAGAEHL